jgi:predicted amidohydrolase YtcJ
MKLKHLLFCLAFFSWVAIQPSCKYFNIKQEKADLVVHNATIYTMDGENTIGQAMAIKNGKIVEIGAEREIMNKYRADEFIDARLRTIYPGFIDAHCHFLNYGLDLQILELKGTESFDAVLARTVKYAANNEEKEWIVGRGWDHTAWAEKEYPNKTELDSLFPNKPVLLRRVDGHAALVNQAALQLAGIDKNTVIDGGIIEKSDGKLTGILVDNAVDAVRDLIPKPTKKEKIEALLAAQQKCFEVGLTTVDDAGLSKPDVDIIDELHKSGKLKMRMYVMLTDNQENFDHYLLNGPHKTKRLNVRSFKFYGDGALGSRGACLLRPYADIHDTTHYGMLLNDTTYFRKYAQLVYDKGFQMNTHCIGDSANRFILNTYASILKGVNDRRWRIEHAQVVAPSDFELFKNYTVIPSVQSTHATSDMRWAEDRVGPERVRGAYAYKDLLDQNGMIALGTDFPVEGINPMNTFYAATVRKDIEGRPRTGFQMENALTREETLKGMTIWAAMSNFEEKEKGSLEPGKYADFVILDRDILKVAPDKILSAAVYATFINGEKVYEE